MTPVESAIQGVTRAINSFHPSSMPRLARAHYRREMTAWPLLAVMQGTIQGGVAGVIAKNAFTGVVSDTWLNLIVPIITSALAYANIISFMWAQLSTGRHKIRIVSTLQLMMSGLIAMIALAPQSWIGLIMLTAGTILAAGCWSGVVTLRTTVWRANYARDARANLAGKIATAQTIALAVTSVAFGLAMKYDPRAYHLLYPLAALAGAIGALNYRRLRMRGHAALRAAERREAAEHADSRVAGLKQAWRILKQDGLYRRFMIAMFLLGISNLSTVALLPVVARSVFGYKYLGGMLLISTIPVVMMPLCIPIWSKLLDKRHIIVFRVLHAWAFVLANAFTVIAVFQVNHTLLWISAVVRGFAFGGGVLGWNLGHHDFARTADSSHYMSIHVSLTGLRGLIGPALCGGLYTWFEWIRPGGGAWVFALCLAINVVGAFAFLVLLRELTPEQRMLKGRGEDN
jgi:MFS family permease